MAGEGQLDLHRRKLHHRHLEPRQGHHQHAAGLYHRDRGAGAVEEKLFHHRQLGLPGADQHPQVAGDLHHPLPFAASRIGADDAAVEQVLGAAAMLLHLNHPVADAGQAGIDAEDPHGSAQHRRQGLGWNCPQQFELRP